MGRVEGKIALVTGGANGIGAASARLLAAEGAAVAITDIDEAGAETLAGEIGALGLAHDATDEASWRRVMDAVHGRFGRLDVLVNNVGGGLPNGDIERRTLDDYHTVMRRNLDSVFIGCKLGIEAMKANGGSIINLSSVHGIRAAPHEAGYSASKGGVRLLTKSVALHCARAGYRIRANSVHPGYILTERMKRWVASSAEGAALMRSLLAQHPIGFLGEPEDVAGAVLYLASDESRFMTGSELVIDGGFTL
jgi:NAD(P)-dependent dehydrogenase (short-subunit alcohol dehydrogenase family)